MSKSEQQSWPAGFEPLRELRRAPTVLSLFTGAGGLDLGLEAAGFRNRGCVEFDDEACATLRANTAWRLAEPGDLLAWSPHDLLKAFDLEPRELSLLSAGPPCQPFSKAGWWHQDARRLDDPRAQTLIALMDFVGVAQPDVVLIENVRGIAYASNDDAVRYIRDRLLEINSAAGTAYSLNLLPINAAHYGVPQRRERMFMIAVRDGREVRMPRSTHADAATVPATSETLPLTTAWDAIGHLRDSDREGEDLGLSGKWAELLPSIPEGQNYLWHTPRGGGEPLFGWRTRYWSFLLKLSKAQPSWTIQASPGPATGPFHWDNRLLSRMELAALQTFPVDYRVEGTRRAVQRQIGNAVPSALGELLGLEVRRQVYGHRVRRSLRLIPISAGSPPPARAPEQVPSKFSLLRAEHLAHPGESLGPGAEARRQRSATAVR